MAAAIDAKPVTDVWFLKVQILDGSRRRRTHNPLAHGVINHEHTPN